MTKTETRPQVSQYTSQLMLSQVSDKSYEPAHAPEEYLEYSLIKLEISLGKKPGRYP